MSLYKPSLAIVCVIASASSFVLSSRPSSSPSHHLRHLLPVGLVVLSSSFACSSAVVGLCSASLLGGKDKEKKVNVRRVLESVLSIIDQISGCNPTFLRTPKYHVISPGFSDPPFWVIPSQNKEGFLEWVDLLPSEKKNP